MNQLYSFLSRIEQKKLKTAPYTKKAKWPTGSGSPYKAMMIASVILGLKQKDLKNGLVTIDAIRPHYLKIFNLLLPDTEFKESSIVQPFWYLGSGQPKIWRLIAAEGASDDLLVAMLKRKQVKTVGVFNALVAGAELDTRDFELLSDPLGARAVTRFLAGEYLSQHPSYENFLNLVAP